MSFDKIFHLRAAVYIYIYFYFDNIASCTAGVYFYFDNIASCSIVPAVVLSHGGSSLALGCGRPEFVGSILVAASSAI